MKKLDKSEIVIGLKLYSPVFNWGIILDDQTLIMKNHNNIELHFPHIPMYANDRKATFRLVNIYDNSDNQMGDIVLGDFYCCLFTREFSVQLTNTINGKLEIIGNLKPRFAKLRKNWFDTLISKKQFYYNQND